MEILQGQSNWKLIVRREQDHIVLLRAQTCDVRAVLPDELFGLPVTVLADHALAPNASAVAGEQVHITCGREGEWDNRNLQDLTLPAFLTDVENYALYGCRSLHTLRLHDRIDRWGGYCLMNCRALRAFHLTRTQARYSEALAYLCGEVHEELDVTVYETDGSLLRLIFPDFSEEYEENCPNHHFDYNIRGGGYPYHNQFRDKQLSMKTYDGLWDKYLREEHDPDTALRLAYTRLRWPAQLSEQSEEQYWAYLRRNKADALLWQLSLRDAQGLRLLLDGLQPEENLLHKACDLARNLQNTEGLALLLEKQNHSPSSGFDKDFDL